jgi:hypothetical protein
MRALLVRDLRRLELVRDERPTPELRDGRLTGRKQERAATHISSQRPCAELGELVRLLLWKLDER